MILAALTAAAHRRPRYGSVSVLDAATEEVIEAVPVGMYPQAMALSRKGNRLYVVNEYGNSVSVVNTMTGKVMKTIAVGFSPLAIAVNHKEHRLYVMNRSSVTIIDTLSDDVLKTVVLSNRPRNIVVDAANKKWLFAEKCG